jgi:hypothetical protein
VICWAFLRIISHIMEREAVRGAAPTSVAEGKRGGRG